MRPLLRCAVRTRRIHTTGLVWNNVSTGGPIFWKVVLLYTFLPILLCLLTKNILKGSTPCGFFLLSRFIAIFSPRLLILVFRKPRSRSHVLKKRLFCYLDFIYQQNPKRYLLVGEGGLRRKRIMETTERCGGEKYTRGRSSAFPRQLVALMCTPETMAFCSVHIHRHFSRDHNSRFTRRRIFFWLQA